MGKEAGVPGQGPVTELGQESTQDSLALGRLRVFHESPFNHQFLVKLSIFSGNPEVRSGHFTYVR